MLDNLIMAYRNQIYDWDLSSWISFYKKNKALSFGFVILLILIIGSIVVLIKTESSLLSFVVLLGEGLAAVFLDRYSIKKYRIFLLGRQHHLDKTVTFLETILPGNNLFNIEQIEELTIRLTKQIESSIPFSRFLTRLNNFSKAIIFPIITYVAGLFSGDLGHLDVKTVASWAVSVILLLGIAGFTWSGVLMILRTITCRNHDAAIAFREDLLDIKLLYFTR